METTRARSHSFQSQGQSSASGNINDRVSARDPRAIISEKKYQKTFNGSIRAIIDALMKRGSTRMSRSEMLALAARTLSEDRDILAEREDEIRLLRSENANLRQAYEALSALAQSGFNQSSPSASVSIMTHQLPSHFVHNPPWSDPEEFGALSSYPLNAHPGQNQFF
ncbi:hypothetical protein SISSUDRAFT_1030543 [Sistotremastrum suecicum HHB10207 ss-3]|uniref:Uncharacterized protein n=1 Tax=Sistotremastrum suecicum HHB10207 ss-3 TaxID=1314776 RepID=A0A166H2J7_9AGAM|nr:hypothetical protein SISSUDRAFT_1030543 [Sistotremastrum suecicum HHB10207 ss-3]